MRRPRRTDSRAERRRSLVLVLVIFFIVLASSLTVLVMASSAQLVRTTRQEHESLLLRQLTDSARAWTRAHGDARIDDSLALPGDGILPEDVSGSVEISIDARRPDVVVIHARIDFCGREVSRTTRFPRSL